MSFIMMKVILWLELIADNIVKCKVKINRLYVDTKKEICLFIDMIHIHNSVYNIWWYSEFHLQYIAISFNEWLNLTV